LNSFVFSPSFEDLLQKGGQCSEWGCPLQLYWCIFHE
jgi:hypothetical protein